MNELKLNNKRTILVGLAFLSICAFWQMYDNLVPLILRETFRMDESLTGAIMAADNILALFLLPLFGGLSDKCRPGRLGRRTPFILAGTAGAVILMNLLPILDNSYFEQAAPFKLVSFVIVLGLLLVSMGTYRSPAVALMPDVTPKPLRSKGNAIINLMGAVGGVLYLGVSVILYPAGKTRGMVHVNYQPLFIIVSVIMVLAVAVLLLTIREPQLAEENRALEKKHPEWNLAEDDGSGSEVLPLPVKRSLVFLLASIALWYAGYNGVTTWFSTYVAEVMGEGIGGTNTCLMVATVGAIVSYLPIGMLASRVGRKRTILAGTVLLTSCFLAGYLLTKNGSNIFETKVIYFGAFSVSGNGAANANFSFSIPSPIYVAFALVGLAWAAINVNSLPMVVEMCKGSDVGKFTGYYYTASMAAQVITPVLAGTLMKEVSYRILFPYAAFFVAMSFVTMLFVRHGDSRAEVKTGLDAFGSMDD